MEVLRSYVLRLYRSGSTGMTGVIESVETGELKRFRSPDELWRVLQTSCDRKRLRSIDHLLEDDQ